MSTHHAQFVGNIYHISIQLWYIAPITTLLHAPLVANMVKTKKVTWNLKGAEHAYFNGLELIFTVKSSQLVWN